MIHLCEKTWQFPDTGMTLRFPPTNILMYLLGQSETISYDYDFTCDTSSCTVVTATINDYNPGNSSINTGKTSSIYDYDPTAYTSTYADSKVYYYGYRYYQPEMGRFINRDPESERGGMNLYGFTRNSPVIFIDVLGRCTLEIVHVPAEGPWPPERQEGDIARFEDVEQPALIWEAIDCPEGEVGHRAVVSSCKGKIWTGGSFDPPTHEMNHYSCLESYESALKSAAIDLGCVCEKDACYLARQKLVTARANVAAEQYKICILTDDCADNGEGNLSHPYCQDLVGTQVSLILKQQALQSAMQAVVSACQ